MRTSNVDFNKKKPTFLRHETSEAVSSEPRAVRDLFGDRRSGTIIIRNDNRDFYRRSGMTNGANQQASGHHPTISATAEVQDSVERIAPEMTKRAAFSTEDDMGSEDSVEKLVKGLLGTKDFNYIG